MSCSHEMYLGYPQRDVEGTYNDRWWASKNKDSFIRFYETDFKEVLHKYDEYWTVSIGYHDEFQLGYKQFDTTREAKQWSDDRSLEDLSILEEIVELMVCNHKVKQGVSTQPEGEDVGF